MSKKDKGKKTVQGGSRDDRYSPYGQGRGVLIDGTGDDRSSPSGGRGLRIGGSGDDRTSHSDGGGPGHAFRAQESQFAHLRSTLRDRDPIDDYQGDDSMDDIDDIADVPNPVNAIDVPLHPDETGILMHYMFYRRIIYDNFYN
ncbi:hypothetical protein Droror1_Dr00016318 [Drosera rotundifolia]